jgi:hypothetical protein
MDVMLIIFAAVGQGLHSKSLQQLDAPTTLLIPIFSVLLLLPILPYQMIILLLMSHGLR